MLSLYWKLKILYWEVIFMSFASRLKQAREQAGLTQQAFADKLGVTKNSISNYENGVSSPKWDILLKIFDVLHVDPNFLYQDNFSPIEAASLRSAIQAVDEQEQAQISELTSDFKKLNDDGKVKALERVHELTEISRYQNLYAIAFEQYKEKNIK